MALSTLQITDVTAILERILGGVEDLRVYTQVTDTVRPPAVVIAQPVITFNDPESGFCSASWAFGMTVIVSRNNDRAAQSAMSRYLLEIATVLDADDVPGVLSIQPIDASPVSVTLSGQELPAYTFRVQVRA